MNRYAFIKNCKTCDYYDEEYEECHRHPPVFCPPFYSYKTDLERKLLFKFPKVRRLDWCGEHETNNFKAC